MYVKYLTPETRQQLTTLLCQYRGEKLGRIEYASAALELIRAEIKAYVSGKPIENGAADIDLSSPVIDDAKNRAEYLRNGRLASETEYLGEIAAGIAIDIDNERSKKVRYATIDNPQQTMLAALGDIAARKQQIRDAVSILGNLIQHEGHVDNVPLLKLFEAEAALITIVEILDEALPE